MAAGDLLEERNEKAKKSGSPQGWEEGKNEGITFPRCTGISFFNILSQFTTSYTSLAMLNFIIAFSSFAMASFLGAVQYGVPLCLMYATVGD